MLVQSVGGEVVEGSVGVAQLRLDVVQLCSQLLKTAFAAAV